MMTEMLATEQKVQGYTRRATVTRAQDGWIYREEADARVVRQVTYTDWHRVERAMRTFESVPGGSTKR